MNLTSAEARNWIIGMWLLSVAIAVVRENQSPNNPGKPLPRPCVLLRGAVLYTMLGAFAMFQPTIGTLVAGGVTLGAFIAPVAGKPAPINVLNDAIGKPNAITGD